ncbi:putative membrane protein YdjX (TVP38/TMEM64 family) [Dokdonella fugitiva]|uniref:TVP38/TMEM64 family membrane protein n=1 Tax=Dokdonella fugitiva TaxID=328517 RepID=A0A839F814_9GAMM|nr:VTT domain-containing protein [Dokdonella fugitiva]MBA8889879.1 putative membrane protein YdjX (TVP38/TMEM64 family) [Dokdonella fugitiva]
MRKRLLAFAGALALVAAAAAAWQLAPRFTDATVADVFDTAQAWRGSAWAIPVLLGAFVVGGLVAFPVNLLVALAIVVLGTRIGAPCALVGVLLSAVVLHEIGRALPERFHARLADPRWRRLRDRILAHGMLAVATVRLVPVAPYSVVSLAAGMLRVRRVDYVAGTALGMAPGIALYAAFADRAEAALRDPHPLAWLSLFGVVVVIVALAWFARARHRAHDGR